MYRLRSSTVGILWIVMFVYLLTSSYMAPLCDISSYMVISTQMVKPMIRRIIMDNPINVFLNIRLYSFLLILYVI